MAITVLKLPKDKVEQFGLLLAESPDAQLLPSTNVHEAFRVKLPRGVVVGYRTGKIVAPTAELQRLRPLVAMSDSNQVSEDLFIIGSDEAGKGESLGPMVMAAVGLDKEQSLSLLTLGAMDSKLVPREILPRLAKRITDRATAYSVVTINPKRLNGLIAEVRDEGKSLNDLLAWGHSAAIEEVLAKKPPLYKRIRIVIDEFDRIKTERRISRLTSLPNVEVIQRHRAEDDVAVAAASILAKAGYERWVTREEKTRGVDLRKMPPDLALSHPDSRSLFKVSFLRSAAARLGQKSE